jgi:hypothetical protein
MNPPDWLRYLTQAEQLFDQKQVDEAAALAEQVLRLNPNFARVHQLLGLVALERDRPLEAIPRFERALALAPDLSYCHNGLGRSYTLLGESERALQHYDRALFFQPGHAFAHFNRALTWLRLGRYREGWLEYEWRWDSKVAARPEIPRPRWDGSPLAGRSILIYTEQGLGDTLQFVRFFPLVRRGAGRLILACLKPLQPLLRPLPSVDEWFPIDEPAAVTFDLCAPMLSLPGLLGIDETNLPRTVPYISADPLRVSRWGERLRALPGFKIGLCWQGSPGFKTDRLRSIPLAQLAPLAALPSVTLISLQKGPGVEQIEANRSQVPLQVLPDLDTEGAYVDTAAIMHHLDLVISVDTATAHLAGALGRPVWVLLPIGGDWRWLAERNDSPWYPTARLFRQQTFGDWSHVLTEVVRELERLTSASHRARPVVAEIAPGELVDKITILEIKSERVTDADKLHNVRLELELLKAVQAEALPSSDRLTALTAELKTVNYALWDVEDALRVCERQGDFGPRFIELARSVYHHNDRRAALKRAVNELLGSRLIEEKSYSSPTA